MSLLAQWQSEAEKASKEGTLKGMVYHGSEKAVNLQKFCAASNGANAPNAIITSYGTILSEYNQVVAQDDNRGSHSGIFSLDYFRIVLDEVYFIKNRQ
jgi:DNA repair protein RAD5